MTQAPTPAVGYIRGSTREQRATILAQYESIVRHAAYANQSLPQDVRRTVEMDDGSTIELVGCFIDAGVSAEKVGFLEREDAAAMVAYMIEYGIKEVIGTKLDRVFRNVDDCRFTVRQLERHGMAFHLLDVGGEKVTTSTAMGQFLLTIMAAVAELENGRRRERQLDVIASHRRRRSSTGHGIVLGNTPFGWDAHKAPDGSASGKRVMLPNEAEQRVLRLIAVEWKDESCNEVARRLNSRKITAKKGGKWFGATVASVRQHAQLAPA